MRYFPSLMLLLLSSATALIAQADTLMALQELGANPAAGALKSYESARVLGLAATKDLSNFESETGIKVTKRDAEGKPAEARIRLLVENPRSKIYVIGPFNDWGKKLSETDRLKPDGTTGYFEGNFRGLVNGTQYRLLVDGHPKLDPSSTTYSSPELLERMGAPSSNELNSVFWDLEEPASAALAPAVDVRGKTVVLGETEIAALVQNWPTEGAGPAHEGETYKYIAESGVIAQLKKMGYTAVEFLPFNSSVDGPRWAFRYLVFGLFGPDSRFGTPEDFRGMVNAFNQAGIAVVMDSVMGHYPSKGNVAPRMLNTVGPASWKKPNGHSVFGDRPSPWRTNRYAYADPGVRRFLIDALLTMLKEYHLSGIRFDNLDGIRGEPGGADFLRMMSEELRAYQPQLLMVGEIFSDTPKDLGSLDQPGNIGLNFRTDSGFFDWIKDNSLLAPSSMNMNHLASALSGPWSGQQQAARVKYLTNHDESSNRRDGATGSYFSTLLSTMGAHSPESDEAKTKTLATIAEFSSPIYLDMPQLRLGQEGSFSKNPGIEWDRLQTAVVAQFSDYFTALSTYVATNDAFAFANMNPDVVNATDDANETISLKRVDHGTGKTIYAIANLGAALTNYEVGVEVSGSLTLVLNSDDTSYGGSGQLDQSVWLHHLATRDEPAQGKPRSILVPYLAPGSVLLLETK